MGKRQTVVVDVGNIFITVGLVAAQDVLASWRVQTRLGATADDYSALFARLLRDTSTAETAIVAGAVPELNQRIVSALDALGFFAECLDESSLGRWVDGKIQDVGVDRVGALLGAQSVTERRPVIALEFGTAIVMDVGTRAGMYRGCVIAPDAAVSMELLLSKTSLRGGSSGGRRGPASVVGKSTARGLSNGLRIGWSAMVTGLLTRIRDETNETYTVVGLGVEPNWMTTDLRACVDLFAPDALLLGYQIISDAVRAG